MGFAAVSHGRVPGEQGSGAVVTSRIVGKFYTLRSISPPLEANVLLRNTFAIWHQNC